MLLHRGGDARGAQFVDEGEEHDVAGCTAFSPQRHPGEGRNRRAAWAADAVTSSRA